MNSKPLNPNSNPIINRIEPYIFYVFCLVHALPIFINQYFLTLDGPAHLYNVSLLNELLTGNSFLEQFYQLNKTISPNISGHLFLLGVGKISSYFFAERCLLLFYILGLPVCFRFYIQNLRPKNYISSYFIFPFIYSFLFMLGLYNFHIGLVLLFLILGLWMKIFQEKDKTKLIIDLSLLCLLLYFSHILIFLLLVFVLVVKNFFIPSSRKTNIEQLIILLPAILLTGFYLLNVIISTNSYEAFTFPQLLHMLLEIEPVKAMQYGKESKYIFLLQISMSIMIVFGILQFFKIQKPKLQSHLLISLVLLIVFFLLPNNTSSGAGLISFRMILFFFLFLIIVFSSFRVPLIVQGITFALVIYASSALLKIYFKQTQINSNIVESIIDMSQKIPEQSVILPLYFSEHPFIGHSSNYLGISKEQILLDNYEAGLNDFPVKWNHSQLPSFTIGDTPLSQLNCFDYPTKNKNPIQKIDYVFVISDKEYNLSSCESKLMNKVEEFYTVVDGKNSMVQLWKVKL